MPQRVDFYDLGYLAWIDVILNGILMIRHGFWRLGDLAWDLVILVVLFVI